MTTGIAVVCIFLFFVGWTMVGVSDTWSLWRIKWGWRRLHRISSDRPHYGLRAVMAQAQYALELERQ